MKPFEQAVIPASELEKAITDIYQKHRQGDPEIRELFKDVPQEKIYDEIVATVTRLHNEQNEMVFKNDVYQVSIRRCNPEMLHLSIKRIDREVIHDWRDLQEIKNQLVGPEYEAVELYPAESRVVDTANQYHLWVVTDPGYRFPFGFSEGRIVSNFSIGGSVQRPRADA